MRGIAPWFLALCILVVVCAIGVSIVHSFNGFSEGFTSESSCSDCEDDDDDCSDITIVSDDPPRRQKELSPEAKLHAGLDQNIAVQSAPIAYSSTSENSDTDSRFKNLLNAIQKRTGSSSIIPTTTNLFMASGNDASGNHPSTDASGSEYKPHQQVITPDQFPLPLKPTLTANVPTDVGTQAENILNGSILTPSMRQMIRTDVKNAVKEGVNDLQNQYEITYEQQ